MHWLSPSSFFKLLMHFREGEHFISGGEDKLVKLWGYDEGMQYFTGTGHSGTITKVFLCISIRFRLP